MRKEKSGVLTVFVCLILVLMLTFLCTVAEAVRIAGSRIQAQAAADSAMDSLFSEYHRPLFENYDLFFISGVYDTGVFAPENLTGRLSAYMSYNLQPEKENRLLQNTDFWLLTPESCRLTSYTVATDHDCSAYRTQAADSMKYEVGKQLLDKLQSWEEDPPDIEALEKSLSDRETKSDEEIRKQEALLREEQEAAGGQEAAGESQDGHGPSGTAALATPEPDAFNPITFIKELKKKGILQLVMPASAEISEKTIPEEESLSKRKLLQGTAGGQEKGLLDDLKEKALFHEYLLSKFSSAVKEKPLHFSEGKALSYKLEYILAGEDKDMDNLKSVVHRLLLVREAANFAYLMTDSVKQVQAETAALAVTGLAGIAPLCKAVKYGILLAWAYGESIMDVRSLLAGGTVAPVKTEATWQLELENIKTLVSGNDKSANVQEGGLDYEGYLRLLLFGEKEETITLRSLTLIEQNIRLQTGEEGFRADGLVAQVTAETSCRIQPLFFSFRFMRQYVYSPSFTAVSEGAYIK